MKIADAFDEINKRRAAVLDDPAHKTEGLLMSPEETARQLEGLGIDFEELHRTVVSHLGHVGRGLESGKLQLQPQLLIALIFDHFVAGVIYAKANDGA